MAHLRTFAVWLAIAAAMTIVTIIIHELAHYGAALAMGASQVKLHWADVTFDAASVDNIGTAIVWLAGPLATHAMILWVWLSKTAHPAALALGVGACSRNMVLLPFTLKLALGRDVSTFTNDEITAAMALNISALGFGGIAAVLGLGGLAVILTRAFRTSGWALVAALIAGTVAGIALWATLGPVLLPGGKGIG